MHADVVVGVGYGDVIEHPDGTRETIPHNAPTQEETGMSIRVADLRSWDAVVQEARTHLVIDLTSTIVVGADGLNPYRYLAVRHECDAHEVAEVRVIFDEEHAAPWLWADGSQVPGRWISDRPAPLARYQVVDALDTCDWITLADLPEAIADAFAELLHASSCDVCDRRAVDVSQVTSHYHDEATVCNECGGAR